MDNDNRATITALLSGTSPTSGDDRRPDHRENGRPSAQRESQDVAGAGSGSGSRDASPGRVNAQSVLTSIFVEFSSRRKQEKVAAWMYLQQALAENAGVLCPIAVSLKDLIAAEANIEDMLKGQQGDAGKSPQEYLEGWLSGDSEVTQ